MGSPRENPFYKQSPPTRGTKLRALRVAPVKPEPPPDLNKAKPFAPWSLPAALFLILGILMAQQALPWFIVAAATLLTALTFIPKKVRWLLPFLLLTPLGFWRYSSWNTQVNPIVPFLGQELSVTGLSDGTYLSLEDGTRVVISPKGSVAAGRVTLKGEFALAQGKRNPGSFDYAGYLRRRNISGQFFVDEVVQFEAARASIKERIRRGVVRDLGNQEAALMQAMTLGIRDDLGDLRELFSASGLAHILALSGLHVGILITALGFALSPLGLRRYPLLILIVMGFVLLVGASPSVLRAGVMTIAALSSLWLGSGRIAVWPSLALSALLVLLYQPAWLFDLSFQLSYLAVMGLLLFTGPLLKLVLGEAYQVLPWWHWKILSVGCAIVSIAAQLTTLPLVASSFGSLPILSPVVNIFAIPLATLLVPLGFLAGIIGLLLPPLASVINLLTEPFANALIWLADAGSSLPNLIWGEVSWLGYALFYVGLTAFALVVNQKLKPVQGVLIVLTAIVCSSVSASQSNAAEIIFLDVGQGDSTLIKLPNRVEILVDGGGTVFSDFDVGGRTVVPALKALGIDELELVIASHSDTDHIEGLLSVLEQLPVGQLVVGAPNYGNALFDKLMLVAAQNNVPVVEVARGQTLELANASLDILNPPIKAFDEPNDNSIAFVLNYEGAPKALLMGDMPREVERNLAFPKVDIVMAGHHGSKTSTSDALLLATQPKHIVFSYGRNSFGHPHSPIIESAQALGAQVHETFHEGAVRLALE